MQHKMKRDRVEQALECVSVALEYLYNTKGQLDAQALAELEEIINSMMLNGGSFIIENN